jgi:tetratricopeptide (TPR) repeat protein
MQKTRYILLLLHFLGAYTFLAQNAKEQAFTKSFVYEYESQYTKAIKPLLELNSEAYEIVLRCGWLYYQNKDYKNAEHYYRKALQQEPSSIEARFGLVLPLSALNNWSAVLAIYLEITKLDPFNSIANYRIASIYFARKEYAQALVYVQKVTRLYPFDFDSNLLCGKILTEQKRLSEARLYLLRAVEYNPQSEEAVAAYKKVQ